MISEIQTDLFYRYINSQLISDIMITDFGYENCAPQKPMVVRNDVANNVIIHFVLGGQGTLNMNKKTYHCKEGDIFFVSHEKFHSYCQDDTNPWKYFWFSVSGEKAIRLFELMGFTVDSPIYTLSDTKAVYERLYYLYKNCELYKNSLEIFSLSVFFDISGFIISERKLNVKDKIKTSKEDYVSFITSYIKNNLTNDTLLTIDTIAQQLCLSSDYVSHLFKDGTGMSIHKYITMLRLQRACIYLETTNMSIKRIAMYVGYSNPLYFSRLFYKYKGQTPSQYREYFLKDNNS